MILSCKGLLLSFWANSIIALTAYLVLVDSFIIHFPIIPTTKVAYYTNSAIKSAKEKNKITRKSQKILSTSYLSVVYITYLLNITKNCNFMLSQRSIRLTAITTTTKMVEV